MSLIGTWMQSVGQWWLVLELTGSPFQLGLVNTLQFAPILLLSPVGGSLSDRLGKRRILLVTQAAMMMQALVLALLVRSGHVRYWHVAVLAVIYGVGRAIDIPARQSFLTDLVGKADLPNAVALNSVVFNGARIVGPAVAGLLIARFDVAFAFFLNAASFVAVLAALLAIRTEGHPDPAGRLGIRQGLVGAVSYALETPPVGFTLALLRRDRPPLSLLAGSAAALSAGVALLALVGHFGVAVASLAVLGCLQIYFSTSCNTTLQLITPHALRGRVMGLYALAFAGMTPFGSLLVGIIAERFGVRTACALGGTTGLLAVGVLSFVSLRRGR